MNNRQRKGFSLWAAIVEPANVQQDVAIRQNARLLSILLLVMTLFFASVDMVLSMRVPGYKIPWYGYVFLATAYTLNHYGKYKAASYLTVAMFPMVIFSNLITGATKSPLIFLNFLVVGVLIGGIFLSSRGMLVFAFFNMLGILALPSLTADSLYQLENTIGSLAVVGIASGLMVVWRNLRNRIEFERQKELTTRDEQLRLALNAANMGFWNWNIVPNEVKWSDEIEPMFGLRKGEFDGTYESYLGLILSEDRSILLNAVENALSGKAPDYSVQHRLLYPDGQLHWLEGKGRVVFDEMGSPIRMMGTVTDITSRKTAELEREKLIEELAGKNAELERFTYTVSHDLKAPIITIKGFLGLLEQDVASGNNIRIRSDVQRIGAATDKMHDLLNDLLELSRIGRMMNPPEIISLDTLVKDVVNILQGRFAEKKVSIHVMQNLPAIYGDRVRIFEVIQNLVDNAAKYLGSQPNPRIEIGMNEEAAENSPVFFVRDNGIGIAPEYHERIFGLFNKLDVNAEGTGIGLALVKRIVEMHGGRIWLESQVGNGATFYFTIPTPRP